MDIQKIPSDDAGDVLKNLTNLIQTTSSGINKKKADLKNLQEMVTSFLGQDSTYQEHDKAAKEAAKVRNGTKSQLLKDPAVSQTIQKIKDLKVELKEHQSSLSDYLREYERMSGTREIEDGQGDILEIIYVAKLVKRSSKFT